MSAETANPRATRWDLLIAALLCVATVIVLLRTTSMGYTRDESFYFRHGGNYQQWVVDSVKTPSSVNVSSVMARWRGMGNNMEHPPLMKALFGLSWRWLSKKYLSISRPYKHASLGWVVPVSGNAHHMGLSVGTPIWLLKPRPVAGDATDRARFVASGRVVSQSPFLVAVSQKKFDGAVYAKLCQARPLSKRQVPTTITGCEARSAGRLHLLREDDAMRFPAIVMAGLLIALIYLFGVELCGRTAALFAALAFLFTPRQFFHAHLTCFDIPITTMVLATQYAFWLSLKRRLWALGAGVIWGIALLTKHNAMIVPFGLVVFWLCAYWREYDVSSTRAFTRARLLWMAATLLIAFAVGAVLASGLGVVCAALGWSIAWGVRVRLPRFPLAFLVMPPLALTILFLGWPALWYHRFDNFYWYLDFHLNHEHYVQYYFGRVLTTPPFPFSFPFVMTLFTVPVLILVCAAIGGVVSYVPWQALLARRFGWMRKSSPLVPFSTSARWFVAINGAVPILLIAMPSTPIFGGVKHWFPTMPYLCLVAGVGFAWSVNLAFRAMRLRVASVRVALASAVALLCLAGPAADSVAYAPVGTAYYNELAGGLQGAANRGMHRQFWGYAGRGVLDWLNRHAPGNATVWFHNATWGAVGMYKNVGLLRHDIRAGSILSAQFAVYYHQKSFEHLRHEIQRAYKTKSPVYQFSADGVPMISVYAKRGALR